GPTPGREADPKDALVRLGATRPQHAGPVEGVAVSPDGATIVSCGGAPDRTVRAWEAATGKRLWQVEQPTRAGAVSRAGLVAAAGVDGVIRLCELAGGREVRQLRGHQGEVTSVTFTAAGQTVISGGRDGTVRTWSAASGKEGLRLRTGAKHMVRA